MLLHLKSRRKSTELVTVVHFVFFLSYVLFYMQMTFRFPLFGKKYQLKFANDMTSETHCLVHFPSLIRLVWYLFRII